ncbi:EAL domain-containing protein [Methylomonas fluvii]|uniref:EAL domain-containing protein n=1 Tax=Methylomonas fluvii TaxID=1854564 RepID=A0ABR9DGA5_9GAMM|nr:EAL domain-containing protein [Methylomonas fluvii]MBD9362134.1 EAL domain-containing protein [Methylomonas fluvii]
MRRFSTFSTAELVRLIGLAVAYALVAKLMLMFFAANHVVSIIWPPAGMALAALLLNGKKLWPGVFLGALLGNLWAGNPWQQALPIACGNSLAALTGAYLLRDIHKLQQPQDYLRILFSGALAALIAAVMGASSLSHFAAISTPPWSANFAYWWMGDVLSIAIITPLILVWRQPPSFSWNLLQACRAWFYATTAFLAGQIIFLSWPLDPGEYGKAFYMFAFIVYGALHFGLHGTLLLIGMVMLQSMFGWIFRVGYFATFNGESSLLLQWSFLLVLSSVGISLALAIERYQRSEQFSKALGDFNKHILSSVQEGVIVYDLHGRIELWNRFMETLTGRPQAACQGKTPIELFPWLAQTPIPNGIQKALKGETVYQAPFTSGDDRWISSMQMPIRDDQDRIVGVVELVKDESLNVEFGKSLSVSELRFQSILDNTPTVIYSKDLQGQYLLINRQFEKLFSVDNETVRGKRDIDLFPGDATKLLWENDLVVVNSGQAQIFEEKLAHQDGTIHTYLSHKFPLRNAQGEIYAVCGISTDISERKLSEKLLQESELRWKFALESGGDGVWDWDLTNGKVFLSPRCMEILNFSEQDRDNDYRNWEATIHPEDSARMMSDLQTHLKNRSPRFSNEHRVKHGDNQWRWILTRGLVIDRDARGKALRMIGTQTDITERKQLQWLQLSKIVDGSPEATLLVGENGVIKLANPPAAKTFIYTLDELIGLTVEALVPERARAKHPEQRARFLEENKARPMSASRSLTAIRGDGTEFPVEISLTPIDIDNRRYIIVSVLDISERKRLEHEMQLMAMIYQAIGEAVMVADADNRIIAINEAFTRLTGYTAEDAIGYSTDILKSGRHDPDFYQTMWHSLLQTGHWQGEIWNKRKNGDIYQEWLVINTIYGEHGEVERRVAMFSEITEQKHVEQTIWRQANFDPLTDLANRRMFQDRLNQEIKKAQRDKNSLAVMLLDLDRFKEINDTMGHGMGDILLKDTARRILSCVRNVDTVARLGGDEFTIILGELDSQTSIDRVAQAILHQLAEPFRLGEELAYISVSIGITFYPQDALEAEQLIKNADQAMYSAKQQGRNRYNFFTSEMEQTAQNRMRLTSDLRQALANQEFCLFYQPIIELSNGKMHKAEALIRWQHPTRGMISPAEFIPLAEETGLIVDIGDWVFRMAAKQVAEWRAQFRPDLQMGINKSPVQFTRSNLGDSKWIDYLHELGLSGQCVVIEITESLLLDADNIVRDHLFAYRDAGIQVAIDDFGTGYSSLSYLKKFDIDYLKIDQSFVRNLEADSSDLALCEAIIVMAHKLGLKVIAEGIETHQQLELLTAAGCDYGQGYLFSKPLPASEFAQLFDTESQRPTPQPAPASRATTPAKPAGRGDSSISKLFGSDK